MKKILLPFLLILVLATNAYCQQLHFIKFIHIGEETKPVGTLIISVEKLIKPRDRGRIDAMFGKSIKTDINTFITVRNFIKNFKYLPNNKQHLSGFEIIDSDGSIHYLFGRNVGRFSDELRPLLIRRNLDKNVIDTFNLY